MRLVQFIKWWWDTNDEDGRSIGCFIVLWAIPCAISSIFFGKISLVLIPIGMLTIIGGWALYGIFYWLRSIWRQFSDAVPPEDVAILRKLKGIPTPNRQEEYYD